MTTQMDEQLSDAVAVIGMAGRFPGANNVAGLWQNLCAGVESVDFFSTDELERAGVPRAVYEHSAYVPAKARLADIAGFDAEFFGFNAREATLTDPQQRLFLECAWEALEDAGHRPQGFRGRIGVYAGQSSNTYLLHHAIRDPAIAESFYLDHLSTMTGAKEDFLATRVAYELDLTGPAMTVQTACSTSLVAIHQACQSLLGAESDLMLAGGVSVTVPDPAGYVYQEGSALSPDGHCRAFDRSASGIVGGNGVGVVVLRRLCDAVRDGDMVHAIIRGSAVNNDGADKSGFTAPSVAGQANVISEALQEAAVSAESIGYVEAHGTATPLGDPIEVAALRQAFRVDTDRVGYCALGSVKTNVGHLDAAAGVVGFIKAVHTVRDGVIPPSLHFHEPNPRLELGTSPFHVASSLTTWPISGVRRAGVNSLGIGGTNAHVVLEQPASVAEPPVASVAIKPAIPVKQVAIAAQSATDALPASAEQVEPEERLGAASPHEVAEPDRVSGPAAAPPRGWQVFVVSARTPLARTEAAHRLAEAVERLDDDAGLADAAYTLQVGRQEFAYRQAVVGQEATDIAAALRTQQPSTAPASRRTPVLLFPGGGSQYVGMGGALYRSESTFAAAVDQCAAIAYTRLGYDLRELLLAAPAEALAAERLASSPGMLAALFTVDYALARTWESWGVMAEAMLGHSLGEYVAACLAGVFSLTDALETVLVRGELLDTLPAGAMLAVALPEAQLRPLLGGKVSLAAVNGPDQCAVSGLPAAVDELERFLQARDVPVRRPRVQQPVHSALTEPILDRFAAHLSQLSLHKPERPFVSNVTGDWIRDTEASDPAYWVRHLRATVRFAEGLHTVLGLAHVALIEAGPGTTLANLTEATVREMSEQPPVAASLPHRQDPTPEQSHLLRSLGQLWTTGVEVDWPALWRGEQRRRRPLPTYPFQHRSYWLGSTPTNQSDDPGGAGEPLQQAGVGAAHADVTRHPRPALPSDYVAATDNIQHHLVEDWQELLGYAPIGVADNFYALGGSSLLLTRLLARLRDRYNVRPSVATFLTTQTIAEQADLLRELVQTKEGERGD